MLLGAALASEAAADTVTLAPVRDNTLYETLDGSLSNGAGDFFFTGRNLTGNKRRALLAFDVAGSVPAGSTITSVTLTLSMDRTSSGAQTVSLHELLADWGEGTSDAGGNPLGGGGSGALATPGDATWIHRFYDTVLWLAPGGDFEAVPSASAVVDQLGSYTWGPTAALAADVQSWLDDPSSSFGWILVGNESAFPTSKRFDSRDHPDPAVRPRLTVEFTSPGGAPAGRLPDGPTLAKSSGDTITLAWGSSCLAGDTDYTVYEGVLGDFTSHVPRLCSTGGATTATFTSPAGSAYYLVAPRNPSREGSLGTDGDGAERPASLAACLPRAIGSCL